MRDVRGLLQGVFLVFVLPFVVGENKKREERESSIVGMVAARVLGC